MEIQTVSSLEDRPQESSFPISPKTTLNDALIADDISLNPRTRGGREGLGREVEFERHSWLAGFHPLLCTSHPILHPLSSHPIPRPFIGYTHKHPIMMKAVVVGVARGVWIDTSWPCSLFALSWKWCLPLFLIWKTFGHEPFQNISTHSLFFKKITLYCEFRCSISYHIRILCETIRGSGDENRTGSSSSCWTNGDRNMAPASESSSTAALDLEWELVKKSELKDEVVLMAAVVFACCRQSMSTIPEEVEGLIEE